MLQNIPIRLNYQPDKTLGVYGTNLYISEKDSNYRLQFEMTVQYAGSAGQELYGFRVTRHHLLIDGRQPDEHAYKLAAECGKIFYPFTLMTNEEGRFAQIRHDDIRQRWAEQKDGLRQEFTGEGTEKYISLLDKKINNPFALSALVEKDLFINLFYGLTYGREICPEEKRINEFTVLPSVAPILFLYRQTSAVSRERIFIRQAGTVHDERLCREFFDNTDLSVSPENEDKRLSGFCRMDYTLSKEEHRIKAIEAEFHLACEQEKIATVRFASYHLEERPVQPVHDNFIEQLNDKSLTSLFSWKRVFGIS